ncbi:hypothetical protein [Thalassobacillus sp. CUG 92003]|uniref:hypothetical protein n=1 Tax=Thalassobacillus sp. CUG 92003 TaxID=2736641 RepID=UPI0015E7203E|nr:hypothetical protein [Thalassobacillus sp. CUG 92003]
MLKKFMSITLGVLLAFSFSSQVFADNHGEPPVDELEQKFENWVIQETDSNLQVKNFDSKAGLKNKLAEIMTDSLANYYVENYYYEEDGNLYIEEKDGPLMVQTDQDYELEAKSDNHYMLTQSGSNQLRDDYTLTVEYKYEDGQWMMEDRNDKIGSEGGEMPDTATSLPLVMSLGALMIVMGFGLTFFRKRSAA